MGVLRPSGVLPKIPPPAFHAPGIAAFHPVPRPHGQQTAQVLARASQFCEPSGGPCHNDIHTPANPYHNPLPHPPCTVLPVDDRALTAS
jgi:hypothetical protein